MPITVRDLHRAVKIHGPNLGELKGKTTRKKADKVQFEPIEVFSEDRSVVLCIDIFFIAGIPFLISFA